MITVVTAINLWVTVVNLKAFRDLFDVVATSRIELPELPPDSYPPIVASCIERFDNPYAEGPGPFDHPPLKVAYIGDLSFQITWRGRSRNLSLKSDRLVEDVSLRMSLETGLATLSVARLAAPNQLELSRSRGARGRPCRRPNGPYL